MKHRASANKEISRIHSLRIADTIHQKFHRRRCHIRFKSEGIF